MITVTVVTGGCDNKTGFEQAPSVNTLGVILHNIMFRDIIGTSHNFSLPVTGATKDGDIHFIGAGSRIGIMQDVMMAMTFFTAGRIRIVF